ncbi:MAG: hypothetical protein ABMA14_19500 [Hyphomonadaceae bacterium]
MKSRTMFLALGVAAGVLLAPSAIACNVQPPGSAAEVAAKVSAQQAEMWDNADLVFVARVEQSRTKTVVGVPHAVQVDMMPLTWLKGQGGPWQFELGYTGESSCGPEPHFDAIAGKPGDTFIVFSQGDTPGQDTVMFTVQSDALVEPRALAALKVQD